MTKKIEFANTLRGYAALSVLIYHYFSVFWVARMSVATFIFAPELSDQISSPFVSSWLSQQPIFNLGAFGVALFFLISGFVIPFSIQKLNMKSFVINRILRIYPTYIIGFTVTLLALYLSAYHFKQHIPYTVKDILLHYFPGIHNIRHTNIDGIIWTLDIEIRFYVLCLLLFGLFKKQNANVLWTPVILSIIVFALMPGIKYFGNDNILLKEALIFTFVGQYLIFMFIGVAYNFYYQGIISSEKMLSIVGVFFALFTVISYFSVYQTYPLTASYALATLIFSFAYAYQNLFRSNKLVNYFADISYPLYVVHGLSGYIILRYCLQQHLPTYVALCITISGTLTAATLLHYFVERTSRDLNKMLAKEPESNLVTLNDFAIKVRETRYT